MGLADDILKPSPLKPVPFPLEWNGEPRMVYIRRWTLAEASEWHRFAQASLDEDGNVKYPDVFRAKCLQLALVDENNNLLFKPEQVTQLTNTEAASVAQLFAAISQVNCLTGAEVAKARESFFKRLKNSVGTSSHGTSEKPTSEPSANDSNATEPQPIG
jgi:hypothetical protein